MVFAHISAREIAVNEKNGIHSMYVWLETWVQITDSFKRMNPAACAYYTESYAKRNWFEFRSKKIVYSTVRAQHVPIAASARANSWNTVRGSFASRFMHKSNGPASGRSQLVFINFSWNYNSFITIYLYSFSTLLLKITCCNIVFNTWNGLYFII